MSAKNVQVVRGWFDKVWNMGRLEAVDELLAVDGIAYGMGESGKDVRGADSFSGLAGLR